MLSTLISRNDHRGLALRDYCKNQALGTCRGLGVLALFVCEETAARAF